MSTGQRSSPAIAVALRYAEEDSAPVVVASGRGELAERIVALAEASNIAIDENPMLATALERAPLGETIPEELYAAVAEVIGWVLNAAPGRPRRRAVSGPAGGEAS